MHGVNLDQLGRRDPEVYGTFTLPELEVRIKGYAAELGFDVTFWQTNHEGEFCEELHRARDRADGLVLNPGAWTHYSYAIRDALEVCGLPAVEVHISEVDSRDDWRRITVIGDLCVGRVQGKGAEGYRDALEILHAELAR
ncbi:MAG: 3-dehydroquinate dehydratase [Solirubrobacterales bacterium]|nr:3-dehydroquinate dehydratase [Solirubrobacterales bacterium]